MTAEAIELFLTQNSTFNRVVLGLKLATGQQLRCTFVRRDDYDELKRFNVWRIINKDQLSTRVENNRLENTSVIDGELIDSIIATNNTPLRR